MAGKSCKREIENKTSDEVSLSNAIDVRKRNRRGQGSKSKQAEAFRSKKNDGSYNDIVKKFENMKITLGYRTQDLFGERSITALIRPQIEIPIDLSCTGLLCQQVAEVLHYACKIPAASEASIDAIQFDVETLMWVTALQFESKLYYSRAGTQFIPSLDQESCFRSQRTRLLLSRALTPLAVVIDQLGRCSIGEQLFVPSINNSSDFVYYRLFDVYNSARINFPCFINSDQPGTLTQHTNHLGQRMRAVTIPEHLGRLAELQIVIGNEFSPRFLQSPSDFQYFGMVDFIPESTPPAPLPFDEIVRRFIELEGRVMKKLANAFIEIDITKGSGRESQLVFRKHLGQSMYFAWSPRSIGADSLEMGALLGLGFPCQLGKEECAAVQSTIDASAGLETLASVLLKRLR